MGISRHQQILRRDRHRWRVNVQRIEEARLSRLWTATDLARNAKLSRPTVRTILSEKRRPNMVTLQLLARALELPFQDLIVFAAPSTTESDSES